MDNDPDEDLVERCRNGDKIAFTALVLRYQRPIYNAAWWILRNADDASDVAQVVFLKVAERLDDYDPQYRFFSWIYRIAVNESLNRLRQDGRTERIEDQEEFAAADSNDPEQRAMAAQLGRRIRGALLTMKANERVVLTLRHFSECSYDEIAEILDVDAKTVKSRLFDARQRLRAMLSDLR